MAYDIAMFIKDGVNFSKASTHLPDFTQLTNPLDWQTSPPTA